MPVSIDVGKFLRLQGAVRQAMEAIPSDQSVVAASAMVEAYLLLRAEVRSMIEEALHEEFDRLFPNQIEGLGGGMRGQAGAFSRARTHLGSLSGWLQGFVEEARLEAEAQAYARERVKQERGVGFGPPE